MKRYAIVRNADTLKQLEAYLPDNYRVIWNTDRHAERPTFIIQGEDVAGWTLDYTIERLYSGMIYATECDLSHPIMKEVPA